MLLLSLLTACSSKKLDFSKYDQMAVTYSQISNLMEYRDKNNVNLDIVVEDGDSSSNVMTVSEVQQCLAEVRNTDTTDGTPSCVTGMGEIQRYLSKIGYNDKGEPEVVTFTPYK
jgi:hypothetical protein